MTRTHKRAGRGSLSGTRSSFRVLGLCALVLVLVLFGFWGRKFAFPSRQQGGESTTGFSNYEGQSVEADRDVFSEYGGSESCRDCHQEEFALWKNSTMKGLMLTTQRWPR